MQAQYQSLGYTVTSPELALAVGYARFEPVNSQYGRLGHLLSDALNYYPPKRDDGSYRWWSMISSGEEISGRGFEWMMHQELAEALEEVGWVKKR